MAHIRQILANLSISASEFKKNPKSVIKAVKSEPIAVIINDKPAFYCVPADILESLYSKFYEMNEIQNIQDLDQADNVGTTTDDDSSFGVRDIFQTVEDEQNSKLMHPASDDFVDPLSNHIADPLDEEVANQLSYSLRPNAKNGGKHKGNDALSDDLAFEPELDDLSHHELDPDPVAFDEPKFDDLDALALTAGADDLITNPDALACSCAAEPISSALGSISTENGFTLPTKTERTVTKAERSVTKAERSVTKAERTATKASKPRKKAKSTPAKKQPESATVAPAAVEPAVAAPAAAPAAVESAAVAPAAVDPMAAATPQEQELEERAAISEAINDVSQQIADNNRGIRRLVSGPHSFTLEHVAKTYSPYAQKKIQAKLKKNKGKKNGNKQ